MNGPEHYKEAERLLADGKAGLVEVERLGGTNEDAMVVVNVFVAAQAHATLAQAAATIAASGKVAATEMTEWRNVLEQR